MRIQRPQRVTILARQLGNGGAERQLHLLAAHLGGGDWDVRVVTLGAHADEYWATRLRQAGVPVQHVAVGPVVNRVLALRRVLREQAPDVVHAFHFNAATYALLARAPTPTPVLAGVRSLPEPWYMRPTVWQRAALYRSALLVCNSDAAARHLRRRFPRAAPSVVVPNGVMLPELACRADARPAARALLGITPAAPVVGIVARLVAQKRIDVFLRSVAVLRRTQPLLQAVVIGSGPERRPLEQLAHELGCADMVRFAGEHPEAHRLVPAFDVLCLSSDTEGAPNVLLEAAAWGVPVVATAVGGVREVVRHAVTGYLVEAGDSEAMAARVDELLHAPARRTTMGNAAIAHVEAAFAIPVMARGYEALYEDAIRTRRARALSVVPA